MGYLIALGLLAILVSLVSALFFLMRKPDDTVSDAQRSRNMNRALAWRVGISIALFLCLLASWKMGWIQPTGLPLRQ